MACRAAEGLPLRGITTLRTPRSVRASPTLFRRSRGRWSLRGLAYGAIDDPLDGRCELGCVGGVALLDGVVHDDAVVALRLCPPGRTTAVDRPRRPGHLRAAEHALQLANRLRETSTNRRRRRWLRRPSVRRRVESSLYEWPWTRSGGARHRLIDVDHQPRAGQSCDARRS